MVVLPPPARTLWPASPPARWSPWQPPPTEQQSCWERWRCRHWPQLITAFLLLRPRNPPPTRGASAHQYSNPIIFKPNNIQTQLYSNPTIFKPNNILPILQITKISATNIPNYQYLSHQHFSSSIIQPTNF